MRFFFSAYNPIKNDKPVICLNWLLLIVFLGSPFCLQAQFQIPDTVCVNSSVTITNPVTASTYFWSFCQANVNVPPLGTSLGNVNGKLSLPANVDYAYDNGNYYALLVNNGISGGLLRLDFGNSLLNTPTAVSLGTFGGIMPDGGEGIQVVKEGSNWYAIIVGGDPLAGSTPRIIKADFGNSLTNTPILTNWGNLGNMGYPHDIYLFKDVNNWYGFVANYRNSTITRFSFGTNFNNPPAATNLGSFNGLLLGPTGLCAINDNGTWRLFVTNFTGNTLARLDFGNSLLNTPSGSANLGNPGGLFSSPRDIMIMNYCSQAVAFVGNDNSDVTRLNFGTLTSSPGYTNLGKIGGPGNIHSISKPFRMGADVFVFLPNSYSNNLTRFQFPGCSNASISNSAAQTPATFSYNTPGTYNISLTVDDGLPTQNTYCKQLVVIAKTATSVSPDTAICGNVAVTLTATGGSVYEWLDPTISNQALASVQVTPSQTTSYKVRIRNSGCAINDTLTTKVTVNPLPVVTASKSNDLGCSFSSAQLTATGGASYQWQPVTGLSNTTIANPVTSATQTTKYFVTATNSNGCNQTDSVNVVVSPMKNLSISADTAVCLGSSVTLQASGGDTYEWLNKNDISNPSQSTVQVTPVQSTSYKVHIYNNACLSNDTLTSKITVNSIPVINIAKSNDINCSFNTSQLSASGGGSYLWSPATGLSDSAIANPVATITQSTKYYVTVTSPAGCSAKDSINVIVASGSNPDQYFVPSAFSPNGDGKNDCFSIKQWGNIANISFSVYNRWGERIFFSNTSSKCWDGRYKSIPQASGTYVYYITFKSFCGIVERKGTVVLIR
ncbi:MAG: gliding motility-associated C-terminal domain-containing protein [Bacteroidota bacterium]